MNPAVSGRFRVPPVKPLCYNPVMYSWKPIYKEAALRLLDYRDRQTDLVQILREMKEAGLNVIPLADRDADGRNSDLPAIDPFTFLATFNRDLTHANLLNNWAFLKKRWNLEAPLPEDFTGLPTLPPHNCWFFVIRPRKTGQILMRVLR